MDEHLRRVLTPELGRPSNSLIGNARLAIRNAMRPSKILRTAYGFVPLGLNREQIIKVEVNLNESASLYPLVDVQVAKLDDDGDMVHATVRSYDIDEMLGTKTRALMQREQGRDLFDLAHAWELSLAGATPYKIDGARTMDAFMWYLEQEGTTFSADDANASLDKRIRNKAFRRDMDSLLRPDLPRFEVDRAADIVREAYFRHLK
nr:MULTISPECIES: nucleotidyl transferase AbiEii/AbiGii toxin family protein [unclassified Rhizobium]